MFKACACFGQYGSVWSSMGKKDALGRDDWIKAGFRALTAEGVQALRVEALARGLKVSKGSFYWHFKNLPDLKAAMIGHWREVATFAVIADVGADTADARAQLQRLVAFATGVDVTDYGGRLVEAAIRAWGLSAPEIAVVVAEVDAVRMDFVARLFVAAGAGKQQAAGFAQMFYATLVGLEQLSDLSVAARGPTLSELLALLLAQLDQI